MDDLKHFYHSYGACNQTRYLDQEATYECAQIYYQIARVVLEEKSTL